MDDDGTMNELAGKYAGMERFAARKAIVQDLKEIGRLIKIDTMIHSVGHSERTGVVVEPRLSTQWFVKMAPLAKKPLITKKQIKQWNSSSKIQSNVFTLDGKCP